MKPSNIKTYEPTDKLPRNFTVTTKGMLENLHRSKELVWQFFIRDFKAKYKQSLLGWSWLLIMPLVTMGTFLFLNMSGVITIGKIPVPYPIFGLLGISLWQIFSNGWGLLTASLLSGSAFIGKVDFPKEVLLIAALGQVLVEFVIRLIVVLIVYVIYGLTPSVGILLLPLYLLPLLLLVLGLGSLTSLLSIIIRDTANFINLGTTFLIFLMPIMYNLPQQELLGLINQYNPLYFLIETPRQIIISGTFMYPEAFLLSSLFALIIFSLGWHIFYVSQSKIAERM